MNRAGQIAVSVVLSLLIVCLVLIATMRVVDGLAQVDWAHVMEALDQTAQDYAKTLSTQAP